MTSSCHIGVIDNDRNRYRMWAYLKALYAPGVNKGCKMITFSHLNSSGFHDTSNKTLCRKKLSRRITIICVILAFSSSLRLGVFSNCFMMNSFTSLLVKPLVCNAASKLNYLGS